MAQPFVARAQEPVTAVTQHFDQELVDSGWVLKLDTGAQLTVFPGVLPGPADVAWSTSTETAPTLPAKTKILGGLYRVTISGVSALNTDRRTLAVVLPDVSSLWARQAWVYDLNTKSWSALDTKFNAKTKKWHAGFKVLDGYIALLQDGATQEGIASWYCRKSCSSRYPRLHGTSNDFPVGSTVNVTSLDNGRSVTVKIISRWGQPAGRVIDLSGPAYDQLRAKNKGLTRVRVTSKPLKAAVATVPAVSPETIPSLTVTASGVGTLPPAAGQAYLVVDVGTGTVLAEKNADTVLPVASLTKLMTAMVVLDARPDFKKVMTYTKADVTPYAYLRIKTGETLTVKDLFYSMLVGSANNAATTLARSTGLTRAQFIAKMNAKAVSFGLSQTKFVDVSGLDPNNRSSASDLAVIAGHAFHDYPLIKSATVAKAYSFTTRNTKIPHTIKSTDQLLVKATGLTITGGKTGYLDEAKYTYVLRTKNAQGAQVLVVLLGSPTASRRFSDAAALANWAWTAYRWS